MLFVKRTSGVLSQHPCAMKTVIVELASWCSFAQFSGIGRRRRENETNRLSLGCSDCSTWERREIQVHCLERQNTRLGLARWKDGFVRLISKDNWFCSGQERAWAFRPLGAIARFAQVPTQETIEPARGPYWGYLRETSSSTHHLTCDISFCERELGWCMPFCSLTSTRITCTD